MKGKEEYGLRKRWTLQAGAQKKNSSSNVSYITSSKANQRTEQRTENSCVPSRVKIASVGEISMSVKKSFQLFVFSEQVNNNNNNNNITNRNVYQQGNLLRAGPRDGKRFL